MAPSATPRDLRLSTDPFPVTATATNSATTSTATIVTSRPTASELIIPTILVDAIASTAWTTISTTVMIRAVPSSGAMLNSGIRH